MWWLSLGCVWRLQIASQPTGAEITLPDGRRVTTPADVQVPFSLVKPAPLVASAPGYRTLKLDLTRRVGPGLAEINLVRLVTWRLTHPIASADPGRRMELRLVPEHGPSGTWGLEQVREGGR
jgi:hypothetical protein